MSPTYFYYEESLMGDFFGNISLKYVFSFYLIQCVKAVGGVLY